MAKLKSPLSVAALTVPESQKRTLKALGLTKMHRSVEVEATAQIRGMINKVQHLVEVKEA